MIKSHEINVTDFNVADSVRRDIKVLATKTRYTVRQLARRSGVAAYGRGREATHTGPARAETLEVLL